MDLKRHVLAYLQRFLVEREIVPPPPLLNLPTDYRGRHPIGIWSPDKQPLASNQATILREEQALGQIPANGLVGPGMVYDSTSSINSTFFHTLESNQSQIHAISGTTTSREARPSAQVCQCFGTIQSWTELEHDRESCNTNKF